MTEARLFLALDLEDSLKTRLGRLTAELGQQLGPVRWVRHENLHLTIRFLGTTPLADLPRIDQALRQVVSRSRCFPISVGGLGVFPGVRRAAVVWIDVIRGQGALNTLATAVLSALEAAGFGAAEHPFVPHVTLGRVKKGKRLPQDRLVGLLEAYANRDLGSSKVSAVTLFASELTSQGPVYRPVASWPLGPLR